MAIKLRDKILVVDIDDEIHSWWGFSYGELRDGFAEFSGQYDSVKIFMNSPGGSVTEGMAIRNEIQRIVETGITIDIEVMGLASSIASVIALAGSSLKMRLGSYLMIHRPYTVAVVDYKEAENLALTLKKMNDDLVQIYTEKSNLSPEQIEEYLAAETWFTAKEAVTHGFASKVILSGEGDILNNANRIISPEDSTIWSSFKNVPAQVLNKDKRIENSDERVFGNPSKETSMDLKQAVAAHPAIQNELETQIVAASEKAQKDDRARVLALVTTALGASGVSAELRASIENGQSEADLVLAMYKNGTLIAKAAEVVPPTNQTNVANHAPGVKPPEGIQSDAVLAAKAEEAKFENLMSTIFPGAK